MPSRIDAEMISGVSLESMKARANLPASPSVSFMALYRQFVARLWLLRAHEPHLAMTQCLRLRSLRPHSGLKAPRLDRLQSFPFSQIAAAPCRIDLRRR